MDVLAPIKQIKENFGIGKNKLFRFSVFLGNPSKISIFFVTANDAIGLELAFLVSGDKENQALKC